MDAHGLAVIGLGLVGSAVVSHAASDLRPIGIGPAEPSDWSSHDGPFASHYDSGRITRRLDARREWAILASRAIDRYAELEEQTGITFHHPTGMVFVRRDSDGVARQRAVAAELGFDLSVADAADFDGHYCFPAGFTCLHEPAPAGFIDPRAMIRAQLRFAQDRGAVIRRAKVVEIARVSAGFRLELSDGTTVLANDVVIATGAYGRRLSDEPLAVSVRPEATILAEVDPGTAAELAIPAAIHLLDHERFEDVYVVPPTRYPDDRWYVKLGGSWKGAVPLANERAMNEWMSGVAADAQLDPMRAVLTDLLPTVPFLSFRMKPCLITDSATGLPMVGRVADGRIIARAGNGHAAKSADAIGALAAGLVRNGHWTDPDLDAADFEPQFGVHDSGEGSRHGT